MVRLKSKSRNMDTPSSNGTSTLNLESVELSPSALSLQDLREQVEFDRLKVELELVQRQNALIRESITFFGDTVLNTETPGFDDESPLGGGFLLQGDGQSKQMSEFAYRNEEELRRIRSRSRFLATNNEFAIGGLENIKNYTVGGHGLAWRVQTKPGARRELTDEEISVVQDLTDIFQTANKWPQYEREYVGRTIRDGEVFTRFFAPKREDRPTLVRIIEPGFIQAPEGKSGHPNFLFGVETMGGDVETIVAYHKRVKEGKTEKIPEEEMVHTKAFVDRNSRRGLPGFYPVETNLNRAEKLLRNMSAVAAIQAAIAMIRKHDNYSRGSVAAFADEQKDFEFHNSLRGKTDRWRQIGPAEIVDAPKGITYEFPATKTNAKNFVEILQAELRAVAARFNMPEFMFTQDASNNNFASTLVAEGPAVKSFESWQGFFTTELKSVMIKMLQIEVIKGTISQDVLDIVCFQVIAPKIEIRDRLKIAQAHEIENANGVISVQTWAEQIGLEYENEQTNLDNHSDRLGIDRANPKPLPLPLDNDDDEEDEESLHKKRIKGKGIKE